jgi:hypothetical protein
MTTDISPTILLDDEKDSLNQGKNASSLHSREWLTRKGMAEVHPMNAEQGAKDAHNHKSWL